MANTINWLERIQETSDFIKQRLNNKLPKTAIILGSGLGAVVEHINVEVEIPYNEVPNFPVSTVEGHKGCLIFGTLGNKYIMAMQGRFHYYEGYSMQEVTFPIRVMKAIGINCVQRIRRHEPGLQGGRPDGHHRPHQRLPGTSVARQEH